MVLRLRDPYADLPQALIDRKHVNPYVAKICEEEGHYPIFYGSALEKCRSKWIDMAHRPRGTELVVEIGCHLGRTLIEMAETFPEKHFLGLDITFKRVFKSAQKATLRGLANVGCALANGSQLTSFFAPEEIDTLVIFFPDPWTKLRTAKHRLINPIFANDAFSCVKQGGQLWFKTDQKPYFEEALDALKNAGWETNTSPTELTSQTFITTFQSKFMKEGLATYEIVLQKPTKPSNVS